MIHVTLETIEVDWNCHPRTVLFGIKESKILGVIGEDLNVTWPYWVPLIEINIARIWDDTKNFNRFVQWIIRTWLHEYLHIELRMESTQPPAGRGTLPIEYKGALEEYYVTNLENALHRDFFQTHLSIYSSKPKKRDSHV